MSIQKTIDHIIARLTRLEKRKPTFPAIWVSTEAVDANLSIIRLTEASEITGTNQIRFVPKLGSVSPVAEDTVICLRDPVIILGVLKGDVNLAQDP